MAQQFLSPSPWRCKSVFLVGVFLFFGGLSSSVVAVSECFICFLRVDNCLFSHFCPPPPQQRKKSPFLEENKMSSSFSAAERRAALLFVQLLGELTERDGGDSEALLLASESVSSAFDVDADRDAASLNPTGARLLDILEDSLASVTEASATAKPTAEERIPLLATLRNSPKFNKYLEVVTSKGIFKGAEVGAFLCLCVVCVCVLAYLCLRICAQESRVPGCAPGSLCWHCRLFFRLCVPVPHLLSILYWFDGLFVCACVR